MTRAAIACSVSILVPAACSRGTIVLGFWIEPVSYASPRLGGSISGTEPAAIEAIARAEIATAFEHFDVVLSGNRQARYHVRVVQRLLDQRFRTRVGRSAVHEFAHQLLPSAPIHDSRDRASYEFDSAARVEHYFGEMRWAAAKPLLEDRLGRL